MMSDKKRINVFRKKMMNEKNPERVKAYKLKIEMLQKKIKEKELKIKEKSRK